MKSHSVATSQLIRGMKRPMLFLDTRDIQKSIKDSVHALLDKKIKDYGLGSFYQVLDTEIRGENGSKWIFSGLQNIDNLKSIEDVDEAWVEEAHTVTDARWKKFIPSIRKEISPCCFVSLGIGDADTKPCSKCGNPVPLAKIIPSRIVVTFNPELEDDATYQRFVIQKPSNSFHLHLTYRDNPWFTGVLRQEMEDLKATNYQEYLHVYEGHTKVAIEGAIYAEALAKARLEERIGQFKYDDRYPVSCFWDIGWNDHTSIVFLQFVNHEARIIDSYQNQFKKTPHYIQVLNDKKYVYDRIVLPHDSENEHGDAEKTWLQQVRLAFRNSNVYAGKKRPVELRLEATKNIFDQLRIDKDNNVDLISALAHYHFAIDPDTKRQTREPFHGPESNFADAFGYMALEMREPVVNKKKPKPRPGGGWRAATGM